MKKMLFEPDLSGHRLEYIHHIYIGMIRHSNSDFVIVVPKTFEKKKSFYEWPPANNVSFLFIEEENLQPIGRVGPLRRSLINTRLLRKYIRQEEADSVFLISLMGYIPSMLFFIPWNVKVFGIIYSIYLYIWSQSSWKQRLMDVAKYLVMRITPCLKTVFILNDQFAPACFNKLYYSNKFRFLPDPYNAIDYIPHNIRVELGAKDDDIIFLHFGGLDKRKGTLDILESISLLPKEKQMHSVFVFAGKIYDTIHDEFYAKKKTLPSHCRVKVYDEFCSNEFLADLCVSCDFILAPYHETNRSSGILGHAAHYGIPVIGPSGGLIGNLIRNYKLGVTLDGCNPESIASAVGGVSPYRVKSTYVKDTSIESFISVIYGQF